MQQNCTERHLDGVTSDQVLSTFKIDENDKKNTDTNSQSNNITNKSDHDTILVSKNISDGNGIHNTRTSTNGNIIHKACADKHTEVAIEGKVNGGGVSLPSGSALKSSDASRRTGARIGLCGGTSAKLTRHHTSQTGENKDNIPSQTINVSQLQKAQDAELKQPQERQQQHQKQHQRYQEPQQQQQRQRQQQMVRQRQRQKKPSLKKVLHSEHPKVYRYDGYLDLQPIGNLQFGCHASACLLNVWYHGNIGCTDYAYSVAGPPHQGKHNLFIFIQYCCVFMLIMNREG